MSRTEAQKEQQREYDKKRYRANKDGYVTVYYLLEEHYVGRTVNLKSRLKHHKNQGKITEGCEVLAKFERDVDAQWFETMLHQRGYNGHHYG